MPLPDERPRQSVANLIGRFEKQKSSASSSAPPIVFPRTSSVASHRTDDSAQEEVKEKREWPPKGVATLVAPPSQLSENRLTPAPLVPPVTNEVSILPEPECATQSMPPPLQEEASRQPKPATAKTPSQDLTLPVRVKPPPPTQAKPVPARTATSVKSPTPKATVKAIPESSHKLQSSGDSASSGSTPLKLQHTGQSTTSAHTATRAIAKPRASAPAKTPVVTTPSRSRTPTSTIHPKTPSSAPRAKTPTSTARSKTPSGGLYAPTAASLARSKVGAPAPPPSEKPKRKPISDLSKPTAASASRIRSPPTVPATKAGKLPVGKSTTTKTATTPNTSKALASSKRPATTKSRPDEKTATREGTSTHPAVSAGSAADPTTAAIPSLATGNLPEISQRDEDVPESPKPDVTEVTEGGVADVGHPTDLHKDLAADEEHQELRGQSGSQGDDEIENYDEDFPEDIVHEPPEEPENGHAMEAVSKSGSLVEHPQEPIMGSDDATLHAPDSHHDMEVVVPEAPQIPTDQSDAFSHSHQGNSVDDQPVDAKPENVVKGPKVESDLEDIVNLLESGPQIQRSSVDVLPVGGTVSEAGEIPDED